MALAKFILLMRFDGYIVLNNIEKDINRDIFAKD